MNHLLNFKFEAACFSVKYLPKKPSDEELLELYGLYKQATLGSNNTSKPSGFLNIKEKKKWESWMKYKSLNSDDAKNQYINLYEKLKLKYK